MCLLHNYYDSLACAVRINSFELCNCEFCYADLKSSQTVLIYGNTATLMLGQLWLSRQTDEDPISIQKSQIAPRLADNGSKHPRDLADNKTALQRRQK